MKTLLGTLNVKVLQQNVTLLHSLNRLFNKHYFVLCRDKNVIHINDERLSLHIKQEREKILSNLGKHTLSLSKTDN